MLSRVLYATQLNETVKNDAPLNYLLVEIKVNRSKALHAVLQYPSVNLVLRSVMILRAQ